MIASLYVAAPDDAPPPASFMTISPALFADLRADAARIDMVEPIFVAAANPTLGVATALRSWRGLVDLSIQICALAFAAVVMLVPAGCASASRALYAN